MQQNKGEIQQSSKVRILKKITIKLQLRLDNEYNEESNENQMTQSAFVYYQDQQEMSIDFVHSKMERDNNNIWFANVEIDPNHGYKYYYKLQQKNKIKQESQTRYFKYDPLGRIAIDEWNCVWCLYRYQVEDPGILEHFQLKIKDYQKKSYQSIDHQNDNEPGVSYLECSETLKLQDQQLKRQFAFIYKNNQDQVELSNQFDPRKGNSFMNNFVLNKFKESIILSNEQEQKIKSCLSKKQVVSTQNNDQQYQKRIQELENKFNMKADEAHNYRLQLDNEIEVKKKTQNTIQKLESQLKDLKEQNRELDHTLQHNQQLYEYNLKERESEYKYQIMKTMEDQNRELQDKLEQISKRNSEMLKKEQERMEEDQRALQTKSQEVVNKYRQMLDEANEQIRNHELKSFNFQSDDITISFIQSEIPDWVQQNIGDLEQTITSYKNIEETLKKEKDDIEQYYHEKNKKEKSLYQKKAQELLKKGENCQKELDKCKIMLEDKIKESEVQADENNFKVQKYKAQLNKLKSQLQKKSDDLAVFIKAYKELEQKLEDEQQKNMLLQRELDDTIRSSEKKRQEEFERFQKDRQDEMKQLQEESQQQLLLEKEKHEQLQREQKYEQQKLIEEMIKFTYQKIGDEILVPYFDAQKKFHDNLIFNFKSEIKTVIKENIENFETPVNQLSYRLSHIEEEQLEEQKMEALQKHEDLVSAIQQFKEDSKIENAKGLKQAFIQYTIECNKISEMAMKTNFMNNQDGEQIYQINHWKSILDQRLDSLQRLLSFSNELSEWYQQFQSSRDIITKAYEDLKMKHQYQ
ncbi:unnamed protein product (macronuclear) [Paramecium tetraurelia]|uniref:AMP-activated protein kinase glycogen-binding domain-containing protein n=1 Tax=Paramecium tetraurelia TaxID=5888 RepID=A0CC51_PARTE|nr:uncharacterized protein GSPATT00037152001 [Paramecium tetraurelia]CAK68368.1 unnamed protein product [Paramecium tetraurelia]|eukprot:XP_001435765.1 hypothetical protein (macronuclear) [Paramecium tetraurelia strain d4-2]